MTTLKPCPFCGGKAKITDGGFSGEQFLVRCRESLCPAASGTVRKTQKQAIAAWNNRAEPELTRCEKCDYWDKSASFMSAHACAFWSSGKKTRYTENYEFCSFAERKEKHHEVD